ncbi:3'-5' exonuclease [Deinococcus soli (ex Cha et al. 2016)]|uniref:Inhibitor of KinA sporulation pathway (Predicted exonuclease) n=2 Tax=Deinococcus soli (ex Cha et al. 2016) TaxID=1309411 RepID=A0AAE3XD01_9DEIO|nr:3'-5' exonuclease [Deinococcus soli (ex Cha et al. 2016)]MDR6218394.1 inhibitor of KinA sporulation pathway (predicted exonuclease) [Deinococcus soli (ex Cha et al. 2016)]MDR6329134.1 inhibitor of KinA sporulation pathway (predicted exonuclease) [Deinococcus soli (ex Cha et al. 2016)]MDR6751407.1 inhibitor of KinA sporulation pathway (predicted exonuclease) [Deinococcus soli (ex Cha et al. 2016)]
MTTVNIIDLESTCWAERLPPEGQRSEIIEIGVASLDLDTLTVTAQAGLLIQPTTSEVSEFCTSLTTITPALLATHGMPFPQACTQLRDQFSALERPWASWGQYDRKMLSAQTTALNLPLPVSTRHTNVKNAVVAALGFPKPLGMARALRHLGWTGTGTHHRGVDDAVNIARIVAEAVRRQPALRETLLSGTPQN